MIGADALNDDAVRALHTLRGSASMAGVDSIARVAGPLYRGRQGSARSRVANRLRHRRLRSAGCVRVAAHAECAVGRQRAASKTSRRSRPRRQRIVAGLGTACAGASALLSLDGAPVLLGASDFLTGWLSGAMDLGALSDIVAALHELRNEAESQGQSGDHEPVRCADRRVRTPRRSSAEPGRHTRRCTARTRQLLGMFDAIAAEQTTARCGEGDPRAGGRARRRTS